ncbi:hypothetical protein BIM11_5190 [Burkholderia pseudomallei]|nr:hypothetical protein DO66_2909 [Burkholderia pseudomallei]OAG59273.1 hypothetical protein BIM11_5190 [Burkholderia pseudomallei]
MSNVFATQQLQEVINFLRPRSLPLSLQAIQSLLCAVTLCLNRTPLLAQFGLALFQDSQVFSEVGRIGFYRRESLQLLSVLDEILHRSLDVARLPLQRQCGISFGLELPHAFGSYTLLLQQLKQHRAVRGQLTLQLSLMQALAMQFT